jgi:hypothetical protein
MSSACAPNECRTGGHDVRDTLNNLGHAARRKLVLTLLPLVPHRLRRQQRMECFEQTQEAEGSETAVVQLVLMQGARVMVE